MEYLNDIKNLGIDLKIYISDRSKNVASFYTNYEKFLITPKVMDNHQKFIDKLLEISKKYKIDLIIPLSDLELLPLSINKSIFKKINTDILVSSKKIIQICENKEKLNNFLKLNKLPHCQNYYSIKNINRDTNKKIVEKPITGSGSKNINIIALKDVKFFKKNYLYQDYITGKEYGLDILNDFNGKFVSYCLKKKIEMRAGETDKVKTLNNLKIYNLSKKISKKLKHIGNLDCDLIIGKDGKINIIDFNCRFGGGYPFTHSIGLNYIYYLICLKLNIKRPKLESKYKEIFISKGINILYEN